MRNFASLAPFSTACARWSGSHAICAGSHVKSISWFKNCRRNWDEPFAGRNWQIELGLSLRELHHLVNEIRGLEIGSLQCEANEDRQEMDLSQNIAGPPDQDPLRLRLASESKHRREKAIAHLPECEQQVLMLYYQQEPTMREVGGLMGVGESRVSQIHTRTVEHLRSVMRN